MNSPNRNLAVIRYIREQHHTVSEAAAHFNISRQWVYTLLHRYDTHGPDAVLPQSKAPKSNPKAIPETLKKRIIDIRINLTRAGFDAGPETIATYLRREGLRTPSTSTIRRVLTNAGLITPQPQKRPRSSYIRFEASSPNECWQADITHLYLTNGTRIDILDFIDDHSRYLLYLTAFNSCTGADVVKAMEHLIDTYDAPASTLTDNGMVFTARLAGARGGRNGFEVLLNKHNIQQKNGRPGHPQTQGKIERFHQTLKRWISKAPPAETIEQLQQQLDEFRQLYNHTRPHRSNHGRTPHEAYTARAKARPGDNTESEWRLRYDKVDKAGRVCIRYAGRQYHLGIGRKYTGERVLMVITDKHVITSLETTGEIIAEHVIDETRDYQKAIWKP